jgi:dihydrofolate reductase
MRKLKYYVATTLDGFIAQENGSFDGYLPAGEHVTDFLASYSWFDIVLMGRKTYQVGLDIGVTNPYPALRQYVFSRSLKESPDPNVTLVSENLPGVVRELKKEDGKDIWLCGGSEIATQLFQEKLIDEIILKLNPVAFGAGIPLFSKRLETAQLELSCHKVYDNGVLLLQYRVK